MKSSIKYIGSFALILLISGCEKIYVKPASSDQNMEDFEAAWNRINEVYPFLDFKNLDWDEIYIDYKYRIEDSRGDEFYQIFSSFLGELKDGHTYFESKGGGRIYPYYPQRYFKDKYAYSPFVVRAYFEDELFVTESRSAEYGILPQNIGYVFLSDFHENYLINEFPGIINFLQNTKGLIIDIRQRRGGSYQNVEAVITRFLSDSLERPKLCFLDEIFEIPAFTPQEPLYLKPVVVIINGATFSAGELTTEILKQLPQITIIGDTTGGGGAASSSYPPGAEGEYKLPSGKKIYIGTGYFERYDGEYFEWNGVPPDIRVENKPEEIEAGVDKQLEFAIDLLK